MVTNFLDIFLVEHQAEFYQPKKLYIPLDFGTLEEHGCFIGSGAIVVFSDKDSIKKVVLNLLKFFNDESCGQCTPCRVGTEKSC